MAPTNPMNGPNSGTAAETPPIIKIIPARSKICELLWRSFEMFGRNLRHKISIGTKNCKPNVNRMAIAIKI